MPVELVMPKMTYDMREGKVMRWLKQRGDQVGRGEPIVEIETDKAVVEVEATVGGRLHEILADEGATVPVGQAIALIAAPDEPMSDAKPRAPTPFDSRPVAPAPAKAAAAPVPETGPAQAGQVRASPLARRLARQKRIDLTQVKGTGPGGRVTREDVEAYASAGGAAAAAPQGPPETAAAAPVGIPLSRVRQAAARITSQSKNAVPHFYLTSAIDVTDAMDLRERMNRQENRQVRITVNDLIIKTCAEALKQFPHLNSTYSGDHLEVHADINIGIAVALEDGLVMPAITACGEKSLPQIADDREDLVRRAREGRLRQEEYAAGTFSISNLGMFDVDEFIAIIYPPQAAILAVGDARLPTVVRDDQVVIRHIMKATLSVDHRVADGALAARFIGAVKRLMEDAGDTPQLAQRPAARPGACHG